MPSKLTKRLYQSRVFKFTTSGQEQYNLYFASQKISSRIPSQRIRRFFKDFDNLEKLKNTVFSSRTVRKSDTLFFQSRLTKTRKDVETDLHEKLSNLSKSRTCRKNIDNSLVIKKTLRIRVEWINTDIFEILTRNHILIIKDELTKFSQVHALSHKKTNNILSYRLL